MRRRLPVELKLAARRTWRLLTFQRVAKHPAALRPMTLLALLLIASLVAIVYETAVSGGTNLGFNEYGLSDEVAHFGLITAGTLFLARRARKTRLSWALSDIATTGAFGFVVLAIMFAAYAFAGYLTNSPNPAVAWLWWGAGWSVFGYLLLVLWRAGRSLWSGEVSLPGLRLVAVSLLPMLLIPAQPVVYGEYTSWSRYDIWYWSREAYASLGKPGAEATAERYIPPATDVEDTLFRQAALLNGTLGGLKPSDDAKPEYFFLAAAPSAAQDVFANEVTEAKEIFDTRFGTRGHSAVLINSFDTLDTVPLANTKNLEVALLEIGKFMDPDNDVLVLFITSHGADGWVSVHLEDYPLNQITPDNLAAALDNARIKNRVLIISACHSGSFIPRLENANTLIMTAARADRTSFGCGNGREWTYFGDALFNNALREETDFIKAFGKAKALVEKWEFWRVMLMQKRSEPQIAIGSEIQRVLNRFSVAGEEQRADTAYELLRK